MQETCLELLLLQAHFKEIMDRNRKQTPKGKPNTSADRKRPAFHKKRNDSKAEYDKPSGRPRPASENKWKTPKGKSDSPVDRKRAPFDKKGKDSETEYDKPARGSRSVSANKWKETKGKPNRLADRKKASFDKKDETTELGSLVDGVRLNKYLANAGVCSRREADNLIESGSVQVNGIVVTQLGTRVGSSDKVQYGGQTLSREKPVYLLLNKPKGFITTSDDPQNRRTVMTLVEKACQERIYPVGRLDRNTTGLLLFTNDGELAKKLMHPKYQIKKVYQVTLDKSLTKNHMLQIAEGLKLEDGVVAPDKIAYVAQAEDKKQVGIEIHSGRNRIVRRIFEHLDYKVVKLDRVLYAGLNKKDLPRSKWRFLSQQEINLLKRLG